MDEDYISGADILVGIDGKDCGHCTNNTITISTETKERTVKPPRTQASSGALFKEKSVKTISVSVNCEGLHFYPESSSGYEAILAKVKAGATVTLKAFRRVGGLTANQDPTTYLFSGPFVCTSLELSAAAGDDATWKATFENAGTVEMLHNDA